MRDQEPRAVMTFFMADVYTLAIKKVMTGFKGNLGLVLLYRVSREVLIAYSYVLYK